jgi:hypothetical protein
LRARGLPDIHVITVAVGKKIVYDTCIDFHGDFLLGERPVSSTGSDFEGRL